MSGALLMILAVTCFAVTHASVKFLQTIPFYEIVWFRALISLVICLVMLRSIRISPWGSNKKILLLRGLFGTCALVLYFYTLQVLPLATAVTIQYLSPMLTILISQYLLKESASPLQWLFFLLAFVGVLLTQDFEGGGSWIPLMAGLAAAFGSAFAYNFVRMLKTTEHELVVVLYFPLVTFASHDSFYCVEVGHACWMGVAGVVDYRGVYPAGPGVYDQVPSKRASCQSEPL